MRIKVEVTEKDIKNGALGDILSCPIALAILRALKGHLTKLHGVHAQEISIQSESEYREIPLSEKAIDFIDTFDEYDPVDLESEDPYVQKCGKRMERKFKKHCKPFNFSFHVPDAWEEKPKKKARKGKK